MLVDLRKIVLGFAGALCFLGILGAAAGPGLPLQAKKQPAEGAEQKAQQYAKNLARWKTLSESEKEKVRKRFKTWNSMSSEEQLVLTDRIRSYRSLAPQKRRFYQREIQRYYGASREERGNLEARFSSWKNVAPRKRVAVRAALAGILSLGAEQRERWKQLSPEKRRKFLRGFFRVARSDRRFDFERISRAPRDRQETQLQRFLALNRDRLHPVFRPIGTISRDRWQSETPFELSPELGRLWRRLSEGERWELRRQIDKLKRDRRREELERLLRENAQD